VTGRSPGPWDWTLGEGAGESLPRWDEAVWPVEVAHPTVDRRGGGFRCSTAYVF